MTSRILPSVEWDRLVGTELGAVVESLPPTTRVVVVEDEQGQIVACWSVIPIVHVEGLWISPDVKGKAGVTRRLWKAMVAAAREAGAQQTVMTGCNDPRVQGLLSKAGAVMVPFAHYVLRIGEHPSWQEQQSLGS